MVLKGKLVGSNPEIAALAGVAVVVVISWIGFFNRYAFDDSYIGYSIAQSLASGHGFVFNTGVRFLSTSAPLAVPLYALLSRASGQSVVSVAQVLSAISLSVVGFGSYALVRRYASIFGAFAAAAIMVSSPFTLMLWSHESLLYVATTILGLLLYTRGAATGAAIVLGLATLFRGEALLVLPFLWVVHFRRYGTKQALTFAAVSLVPYASWATFATVYFGGFLSETIASKRAQLRYDGIVPYLTGLALYIVVMFRFTARLALWGVLVVYFTLTCVLAGAVAGNLRPAYRCILLWALGTTVLYVILELPFYAWFTLQIGAAMAASAALVWPRDRRLKKLVIVSFGRICSIGLLCSNVAFLVLNVHSERRLAYGPLAGVMSSIPHNAYRTLGEWFSMHAAPRDSLSFAEFGQLRYYSGRTVVDYLGIATPGAAEQLANGNAIWTFKRYRPTWLIESTPWHLFVSPLEYDWLRAAYEYRATFHFSGDPIRSDFEIYRLRPGAVVPPADERDNTAVVRRIDRRQNSAFEVTFDTTRVGMSEVEARVALREPCRRFKITLSRRGRPVAWRDVSVPTGISRVTLAFPPRGEIGAYDLRLGGCPLSLAPPLPLRRGFLALTLGATGTRILQDALIVYRR